jgi:hypothetical protein
VTTTETTPAQEPTLIELIYARSATDLQFRAALLADPRATLAELGLPLPADMTVSVVESTGDTLKLPIPPLATEGELADDELAQVNGGVFPVFMALGLGLSAVGSFFVGRAMS